MIVVGRAGWHPGVIGIVASRLVEKYYRPAIVIAFSAEKGKGSGRSIKKFNLFHAMESCKDLFEEFGGHEQAAGLVIKPENISMLRKRINEYAMSQYPADIFEKKIPVDMQLRLDQLTTTFLQELKFLEPHGAGNPRPVFRTTGLEVKARPERIGRDALKFFLTDGSMVCEAMAPERIAENLSWVERGMKVDACYCVKTRLRDGIESLSLQLESVTNCHSDPPRLTAEKNLR